MEKEKSSLETKFEELEEKFKAAQSELDEISKQLEDL